MTPRRTLPGTAAAPLLYWLLLVCGLAGVTVLRIDSPKSLVPLWLGSVAGVALGQLLAWCRVRAWLVVMAMGVVMWLLAAFLVALFKSLGGDLETCLGAFVPAAVCGYLSLSERSSLVAFWYPAMLWMLVILDRPGGAALEGGTTVTVHRLLG